ncbi:serine hydrolase, partial [Streptomyces sp. 13-12-16]
RRAADTALRERLERLALPPADGGPAVPERAGDWSGAAFTPEGGGCDDQPKLTAAEVTADADGGWTLTLTEDGERFGARFFAGQGWTTAEEPVPAAASGGWNDGDTLTVDLVFLETPHRLRVTCSLTGRTF